MVQKYLHHSLKLSIKHLTGFMFQPATDTQNMTTFANFQVRNDNLMPLGPFEEIDITPQNDIMPPATLDDEPTTTQNNIIPFGTIGDMNSTPPSSPTTVHNVLVAPPAPKRALRVNNAFTANITPTQLWFPIDAAIFAQEQMDGEI